MARHELPGGAPTDANLAPVIQTGTLTQTALRTALPTLSGNAMALRAFRAALANRNTSRCNMMHIGDSITWGYIPSPSGVPSYANAWTSILRDTLRNRFPTTSSNVGGLGYISSKQDYGAVRSDAPVSHVGGSPSGTYGLDRETRIITSGATETITFTGTGIDIQYLVWSGGGTFSWTVDGGAVTNVTTTNATTNNNNIVQVRGLTAGTHTLVIGFVSGGSCFVGGYYAYNGDEASGIGSWMLALPGVESTYWTDPANPHWSDALSWVAPDLVTIELGANDYNQSSYVPASAYQTNITNLISTIRSVTGKNPSIVLIPVWELLKTGTNPSTWQDYVNVMYTLANNDPNNICVFDAQQRVRIGQPGNVAGGILCSADGAHLTPYGNRYIAESLATFLAPQ